jgi:excisionase family DNA binding protein
MTTLLAGPVQSMTLPEPEITLARASSDALAKFVATDNHPLTLRLENSQTGQQIEATIPAVAVRVLAEVLAKMAEGHPVTLVPLHAELSTQQAADLIGVSRPYFIKLLEQGKMPYRKVGEQRRVRYQDLLCYIAEYQKAANAALDEMTTEAERMGLYEGNSP